MFDLKKYSVKEVIDYAIKGSVIRPLIIDTSENRIPYHVGRAGYCQSYAFNGVKYYANSHCFASRSFESHENAEFTIREVDSNYKLHYISERYCEQLELDNCGFSYKIKKDGTKNLSTKRYVFDDDRRLRMDVQRQEYTWYFTNHRYTKKVNRNGTIELYLHLPNGVNIREYYNSKGVCTCSLLHFNDGASIQMHYKHKKVTFWSTDGLGGRNGTLRKNIVLPNLNDASIINLYNPLNCFEVDLMMPSNEMFRSYQNGLSLLKKSIKYCLETDKGNKQMLGMMLGQIEMKENETEVEV